MRQRSAGKSVTATARVVRLFVVATMMSIIAVLSAQNPALAAPKAVFQQQIEGNYTAIGRNPDGSHYEGQANVTVKDGTVFIRWTIAGDTFHGQGQRSGNTLVIDWGQVDPVIYQIETDGTLRGTWAAGKGTDTLHPVR